jgi:hypothetical protein
MPEKLSAPRSGDTGPKRIVNELIIYFGGSIARARKRRGGLAGDALDLVDRVVLAVDRQQRGRLGQIYRIDHALYLGGDGHGIAAVSVAVAVSLYFPSGHCVPSLPLPFQVKA